MNDTLKTHKKKIIGGGAGVTAVGIILFFWQLGIGPSDLKALPEIGKKMVVIEQRIDSMEASLMLEISDSKKAREQLTKEVATLNAQVAIMHEMQTEMRQDIKELLRR